MLAHEIRQKYIEFFQSKGHTLLPSAPLIPVNVLGNLDEATLFTGSGMEQFKPYFAGTATPPATRVTTVQKCVRTNDIDSVGDFSHCTFFEMLGNFSFGDYFKAEVIPWTWEFLTQIVGLEPNRFCVTIFTDDEEAFHLWHDVIGLGADRIHRLGEDKNFWPASVLSNGPNGPCGPNSEIFYRVVPLDEMTDDPALTPTQRFLVDDEAGRWLEVWNNVFTQFDRQEDGDGKAVLIPLPRKNNDTGAGLDRIAYASQGKSSVFETDLFGPTLDRIAELSGKVYEGTMSPTDFAFRVVAEHTRAMVFCIADGILPGNEGRGYVLRYLMRRAIRYGKMALGFDAPFLHEVAPAILAQMGDFYTELREREALILQTVRLEEEQFRRTLDRGTGLLDEMLQSGTVQETRILSGADAFTLYDTYGFPLNLTQEMASERGIVVDLPGYERELQAQKERSRGGSSIEKDVFSKAALRGGPGSDIAPTVFRGYDRHEVEAHVLALYRGEESVQSSNEGDEITVVLDETPFYAESGGQVGDTGNLQSVAPDDGMVSVAILDTRKRGGVFLHQAKIQQGTLRVGQLVEAHVLGDRRADIRRNHTATHLLQAALREVLGDHVHQKGSEVSPDSLRFDFTHTAPVSPTDLQSVEQTVNRWVLAGEPVTIDADVPIAEAKARGAMALFGEKYGDRVRVVEIPGVSLELCGGTHVAHTAQIGLFKIVRETGVASGVRRIEAVTGRGAYRYVNEREARLVQAATLLKTNPNDVLTALERLIGQRQELEKQVRQLKLSGGPQAANLQPENVGGVSVVGQLIPDTDVETLASLAEATAQKLGSAVVVLASVNEGKVNFAARVTKDLTGRGLHAGNLIRDVAKITGGGGGGRPEYAQAGGRDADKVPDALDALAGLVTAALNR